MFTEDDEAPEAQEYMSKRLLMRKHHVAGIGTHQQFYDQFVTPGLVTFVKQEFIKSQSWRPSEDPHLNDCGFGIGKWDKMAESIPDHILRRMCEANEGGISLSQKVCVLKAAGRKAQQEILEERKVIAQEFDANDWSSNPHGGEGVTEPIRK